MPCRDEPVSNTQEIEAMYANAEQARLGKQSLVEDVLNISNVLTDGAAAMVDDSFNKCFTSLRPEPWNWNIYLYPCWVMGVLLRYVGMDTAPCMHAPKWIMIGYVLHHVPVQQQKTSTLVCSSQQGHTNSPRHGCTRLDLQHMLALAPHACVSLCSLSHSTCAILVLDLPACRYLILAPLRITMLVISFGSLVLIFLAVDTLLAGMPKQRAAIERRLVQAICAVWVMSWHGVIR